MSLPFSRNECSQIGRLSRWCYSYTLNVFQPNVCPQLPNDIVLWEAEGQTVFRLSDALGAVGQGLALADAAECAWQYKDPNGGVHGPFTLVQLQASLSSQSQSSTNSAVAESQTHLVATAQQQQQRLM